MENTSENYLKVFEKIHSSEIIKEKTEEIISWESQYLKSLREVVDSEREQQEDWLSKLNIFSLKALQLDKSPLINYLMNILKKESK